MSSYRLASNKRELRCFSDPVMGAASFPLPNEPGDYAEDVGGGDVIVKRKDGKAIAICSRDVWEEIRKRGEA